VDLKDTGTVTGFTVVRYDEPHQPAKPPYILALIKLDGADTALTHIVKSVPISKMRVGLRVQAVFAKKTTSTIMDIDHFRPIEPKVKLGYSYDELELGMSASFTKTITETDVYLFAGISGDFNPMHLNEEFAKATPFGTRITHGALPQCLIATVLGMHLPGLGTVALEITTRFRAPTYFGDTVTARAEVVEKLEKRRWVRMALTWTNQRNETICEGTALVMPPTPLPE
jgi:acyl dehydratase